MQSLTVEAATSCFLALEMNIASPSPWCSDTFIASVRDTHIDTGEYIGIVVGVEEV